LQSVRWVFAETEVYRFWLTVLPDNARARHVYASHGFLEEGVLRGVFRFSDGRRGDLVMVSILRPDWLARPRVTSE
jgi:RimJ/RimL family protein N-acetyltransferase